MQSSCDLHISDKYVDYVKKKEKKNTKLNQR